MPPRSRTWRLCAPLLLLAVLLPPLLSPAVAGTATPAWRQPVRPGWKEGVARNGWIESKLRHMTLEEKVGQLFMTYVYGQSVEDNSPAMVAANRAVHGVDNFAQLIEKYHLGGVIYFAWSNNLQAPEQIARLSNGIQHSAMSLRMPIPLLISTDQEQGVVVRIAEPATLLPGNMALGAARSPEAAYQAAVISGRELRAMGVNQDLAPVADVNVNALNPVIGVRSFGENPALVSELVLAQVHGYQQEGVAATAKHFPGHGDTNVDSHTGLPVIDHTLEELAAIDLPPFEAAIDRGIDSIMTAHIVVPALDDSGRPATLSRPILTGVLRERLGYDGVIITDSLGMEGVRQMFGDDRVPVEALKAGADILLMPPDIDLAYNAVLNAVRSGEISEARLDESVYRILRLKLYRGLFKNPYADEAALPRVVGAPEHLAEADAITEKTVTLLKNEAGVLPLAANSGQRVLVTGWGPKPTAVLAGHLAARGVSTTVFETGTSPSATTRQAAVTRAQASDLIVVTTMKAWSSPAQQSLVRALQATGKPVVVVAIRDPYDIAYFTSVQTYLTTYSTSPVSMKALARVLFGEIAAQGRLPVTIPVAGQPDVPLYPYGARWEAP